MKIYRIENPVSKHGMWYKEDGTFDPFIYKLTEGISKDLPMLFNPEHKEGGIDWCSAGSSIEQMNMWFSPLDALELMQNGYNLYEMQVTTFKKMEHEVLFSRDSIVSQVEIPLGLIWDINSLNK